MFGVLLYVSIIAFIIIGIIFTFFRVVVKARNNSYKNYIKRKRLFMFIKIKTNPPDSGSEVLVKLETGVITGAMYYSVRSDIQSNFSPIGLSPNFGEFPTFNSKIVSWMPLDALTS